MFKINDLHSFYDSSHILHGMSLELKKGDVLAILGRNGVGKTTLLKSLVGLTSRTTGSILLNNTEISTLATHERARAGIAYVPQGRDIIPGFSVLDNILMGCYASPDGSRTVPDFIWDLFPFLKEHLNRPGVNLSGGQQQQLAIARALASKPKVILLDEPTEGIQPNIVQEIERTIRRMYQELGLTVIVVEQKIGFVRSVASDFIFIEKGRIAAKGVVSELTQELCHKHLGV